MSLTTPAAKIKENFVTNSDLQVLLKYPAARKSPCIGRKEQSLILEEETNKVNKTQAEKIDHGQQE